jgi:hypothetical protein
VKLGALGIPAYRSFSLVELEAATDNFEVSSLMGQDAHGQVNHVLIVADFFHFGVVVPENVFFGQLVFAICAH